MTIYDTTSIVKWYTPVHHARDEGYREHERNHRTGVCEDAEKCNPMVLWGGGLNSIDA